MNTLAKTKDQVWCRKCNYVEIWEEFEQYDELDNTLCETCPKCGATLVTYLPNDICRFIEW